MKDRLSRRKRSAILLIVLLSAPLLMGTRLSIALEYYFMDACVSQFAHNIYECACALEQTIEDGWAPDYDNGDLETRNDRDKFMAEYKYYARNIKEQSKFLKRFGNHYKDCTY